MPITKNGQNQIEYTAPTNQDRLNETGVAEDDDFAVCDKDNVLKQVRFEVNPLTSAPGVLTLQVDVGANQTINLNTVAGVGSFSTMQPISGTSPVATSATDTLTFVSGNGSISISGNSTTDTLDFRALSTPAPTGTGFVHITAGAQDAAAKLVVNADVSASAAIDLTKLASGTVNRFIKNSSAGVVSENGTTFTATRVPFGTTNGELTDSADFTIASDIITTASRAISFGGTFNTGWTEPNLGGGSRLLFYPRKAAFRAGRVSTTQWNNANIGTDSVAFGQNNTASGSGSLCAGSGGIASGSYSVTIGNGNSSSANAAMCFGTNCIASATGALAVGDFSEASGAYSFAQGSASASGDYSVALGASTASAFGAFAAGVSSVASATSAISMGTGYTNSVANSFALGWSAAASLTVNTTNLVANTNVKLNTVGNGVYVKEGTNATSGVATLSGGTVTVNTTKVTATSRIQITIQGGTLTNVGSTYVASRIAGTSFTIASTNILDASDVAWLIIEPA